VVFRAAECEHAFAGGDAARIHDARDRRGADERRGRDARMVQDRFDERAVALEHIVDAVGQAGVFGQFTETQGRERHLRSVCG
jgi:hypothetical protein